ncbi:hypothetical protein Hanom_Chr06g00546091 [Helianthus anomalus]
MHLFLLCISENKGGLNQLNQIHSSAFMSLIEDWDYDYSAFVFDNMKKNLEGARKEMFLMNPRFIQMIMNAKCPELVRGVNSLDIKPMGQGCFRAIKQNRSNAKKKFLGLYP